MDKPGTWQLSVHGEGQELVHLPNGATIVANPRFSYMEIKLPVDPPNIDRDALVAVLNDAAARASMVLGRMAEAALWATATSFTTEDPQEWPPTWMMPELPDVASVRGQYERSMDRADVAEQEPRSAQEFLELKRIQSAAAQQAQRRGRVKPWEDKGKRFR